MITVNTKVLEQCYTTAQWLANDPVLPDRVLGYDSAVLSYKIGDGVSKWSELDYWSQYIEPQVIGLSISAGQPSVKTLDSTQISILNSYGRYPNFYATYADIQPTYTGNPGSFTAVSIQLHPDASNNNAEDTYIQFS